MKTYSEIKNLSQKDLRTFLTGLSDREHSAFLSSMSEKEHKTFLRETHTFSDPKDVEDLIRKHKGKAILLVVDAQREYCDPKMGRAGQETEAMAEHIRSIIPAFRKASLPVYAIYTTWNGAEKERDKIAFHKFEPQPEDKLFAKSTSSAFKSGKLKEALAKQDRKLLLVCGFYQAGCVKETVLSARELGYDVCVMDDLAENEAKYMQFRYIMSKVMDEKGAAVTTSDHVLKFLRKSAPGLR